MLNRPAWPLVACFRCNGTLPDPLSPVVSSKGVANVSAESQTAGSD
jgi:hypothetical protein